MSKWLAVLLDDVPRFEFDHAVEVPSQQLSYLDDMDQRMSAGIQLDGQWVTDPDIQARTRFVAQALATALQAGDEGYAQAMCTWLGVRRPTLQQVIIKSGGGGLSVDLDYEHPYEKPQPKPQVVQFHPRQLNS